MTQWWRSFAYVFARGICFIVTFHLFHLLQLPLLAEHQYRRRVESESEVHEPVSCAINFHFFNDTLPIGKNGRWLLLPTSLEKRVFQNMTLESVSVASAAQPIHNIKRNTRENSNRPNRINHRNKKMCGGFSFVRLFVHGRITRTNDADTVK